MMGKPEDIGDKSSGRLGLECAAQHTQQRLWLGSGLITEARPAAQLDALPSFV